MIIIHQTQVQILLIVQAFNQKKCEKVAEYLADKGIKTLAYHAGMTDTDRQKIQEYRKDNIECQVVCAPIAFGMCIEKPGVRYVIHLDLPKSIEGYYQGNLLQ